MSKIVLKQSDNVNVCQDLGSNIGNINLDYFYCRFPKIYLFHFESSPLHQNTIDMFLYKKPLDENTSKKAK